MVSKSRGKLMLFGKHKNSHIQTLGPLESLCKVLIYCWEYGEGGEPGSLGGIVFDTGS